MDKGCSCLHPNPGWIKKTGDSKSEYSFIDDASAQIGKHCILELYGCDQIKLNDEAFLRTTITSAAKFAGATLLNLISHHFEPQGVTALALLAESHISIHTWPETKYAAIDVFTCGNHTMPEKACRFLCQEFLAEKYLLKNIERQGPNSI